MSGASLVPSGALLFLVAVLAFLLLQLVLNMWQERANLRANLLRAAGAVLLGIAAFVATMVWLGEPIRAGELVVFSTTLALLFLGRPDQRNNCNSNS
jgi:hypothetical protein